MITVTCRNPTSDSKQCNHSCPRSDIFGGSHNRLSSNGHRQPAHEYYVSNACFPLLNKNIPVDPSLRKRCLKPRGQFRSESCNKYVNCWDDVVIEQECPEGLLFSNKGYCDYPHNVDCQNSSAPPRKNTSLVFFPFCSNLFFRKRRSCLERVSSRFWYV
jgi:hypothetical protein